MATPSAFYDSPLHQRFNTYPALESIARIQPQSNHKVYPIPRWPETSASGNPHWLDRQPSARLTAVFEISLTCLGEALWEKRDPWSSLVICKLLWTAEMASVPTLQKKTLEESGKSYNELIRRSWCNYILYFALDCSSPKNDINRQYHVWMTEPKQLHRLVLISSSFSLPWQGSLALRTETLLKQNILPPTPLSFCMYSGRVTAPVLSIIASSSHKRSF